jgi:hypothetical protein
LFFAPSEVGRRQEEWGRAAYAHRCAEAIAEFVEGSRAWMRVEHRIGPDATRAAWNDVYAGAVEPSTGIVAVVGTPPVAS